MNFHIFWSLRKVFTENPGFFQYSLFEENAYLLLNILYPPVTDKALSSHTKLNYFFAGNIYTLWRETVCIHIFQNRGFNHWKEISKWHRSMDLHSTTSHSVHNYPIRFLSEPQYLKFIINHLSKLQGQQSTLLFWTVIKTHVEVLWANCLALSNDIRLFCSEDLIKTDTTSPYLTQHHVLAQNTDRRDTQYSM